MRKNIGLYRGKREDNGEWIEGYLYPSTGRDKGKWLITVVSLDSNTSNTYSVIPDTVGEFTGLFDKYGNGIFEGDVVLYFGEGNLVEWDDSEATFFLSNEDNERCYFDDVDNDLMFIIGNIHDSIDLFDKGH